MAKVWLEENFGLITRRFCAWLCDLWFSWVLTGMVYILTRGLTYTAGGVAYNPPIMTYLTTEVICMVYYTFTMASKHQATPFMRLFRVKLILSVDGGNPSYRQVFIAHFIFTIFQYWKVRLITIPLLFGYTQVELMNSPTAFGHLYQGLTILGKQAAFTIICFPIFLSMGRKSLGNIISGTEIRYVPKVPRQGIINSSSCAIKRVFLCRQLRQPLIEHPLVQLCQKQIIRRVAFVHVGIAEGAFAVGEDFPVLREMDHRAG